jgi:hypothetical protein
LQAQCDKISRFEEQLKHNRSYALYPNFLAAKWRELWEREKKQRREQEPREARDGKIIKEEGEMNS